MTMSEHPDVALPAIVIEAAARALHDLDCPDRDCTATEIGGSYGEAVGVALAAALGVCEVREEWQHSDSHSAVPWWNTSRGRCCPPVRRLSIMTPAELVDIEGAAT